MAALAAVATHIRVTVNYREITVTVLVPERLQPFVLLALVLAHALFQALPS